MFRMCRGVKATTHMLLKAGADPALVDAEGHTAQQVAAEQGNGKVEELLSQHAAQLADAQLPPALKTPATAKRSCRCTVSDKTLS